MPGEIRRPALRSASKTPPPPPEPVEPPSLRPAAALDEMDVRRSLAHWSVALGVSRRSQPNAGSSAYLNACLIRDALEFACRKRGDACSAALRSIARAFERTPSRGVEAGERGVQAAYASFCDEVSALEADGTPIIFLTGDPPRERSPGHIAVLLIERQADHDLLTVYGLQPDLTTPADWMIDEEELEATMRWARNSGRVQVRCAPTGDRLLDWCRMRDNNPEVAELMSPVWAPNGPAWKLPLGWQRDQSATVGALLDVMQNPDFVIEEDPCATVILALVDGCEKVSEGELQPMQDNENCPYASPFGLLADKLEGDELSVFQEAVGALVAAQARRDFETAKAALRHSSQRGLPDLALDPARAEEGAQSAARRARARAQEAAAGLGRNKVPAKFLKRPVLRRLVDPEGRGGTP